MKLAVFLILFGFYSISGRADGLIRPTYASAKIEVEEPDVIDCPDALTGWKVDLGEVYIVLGGDTSTRTLRPMRDGEIFRNYIVKCGPVKLSIPHEQLSLIPSDNADYSKAEQIYQKELKQALAQIEKDAREQRDAKKAEDDANYKAALLEEMRRPPVLIIQNR